MSTSCSLVGLFNKSYGRPLQALPVGERLLMLVLLGVLLYLSTVWKILKERKAL